MLRMKLKICFNHWKGLPEAEKQSATAKHLRAACEAGIALGAKYDEERAEAVRLRLEAERTEKLGAEVVRLNKLIARHNDAGDIQHRLDGAEYWTWQRDGGNDLGSLAANTPVVIRSRDLQDLVDALAQWKRNYKRLKERG